MEGIPFIAETGQVSIPNSTIKTLHRAGRGHRADAFQFLIVRLRLALELEYHGNSRVSIPNSTIKTLRSICIIMDTSSFNS